MTARNETSARLPVPLASSASPGAARGGAPRADAGFAAQLGGAGGARRGIRGGPPVLDAARASYLRTQWSGGAERRSPAGAITRRSV